MPDWKQKRGWLNRTLEKVEDLPVRALTGDRPLTDSAKRELFEKGIDGKARIIDAPSERRVSDVQVAAGSFRFRVEVEGREPWEVKSWQEYGRYEWDRMRPGMIVHCKVHPEDEQRVLLVPPEPGELAVLDSAGILREGRRARARVVEAKPLGQKAPNGVDEFFLIAIELASEHEPDPWKVAVGQRVPKGAEPLIEPGSELEAAYMAVDEGDTVAIDWSASSGGRFS